jgi:hypothetical protein
MNEALLPGVLRGKLRLPEGSCKDTKALLKATQRRALIETNFPKGFS